MSINDPIWYSQEYSRIVQHLAQQKQSRFRGAVMTGTHSGASASPVNQIGLVEMSDVTDRYAPMQRTDAPLDRRWLAPLSNDLEQLVDSFDALKTIVDPQSSEAQAAANAANRAVDKRIGSAFFASAMTGVTGGTTTTFPTSTTTNVVSVNTGGTASGINVAKLEEGRQKLLAAEEDLENDPIYVGITSLDHQKLINEIQIISLDFNERPVYDANGLIKSWRGFNFIHSEMNWLTTTATDDQSGASRALPMWVKSAMWFGVWGDISTDISQRKDLRSLPWQVYTTLTCNATRLRESGVIKIWAR
jgi:hypothetical protein